MLKLDAWIGRSLCRTSALRRETPCLYEGFFEWSSVKTSVSVMRTQVKSRAAYRSMTH